MPIRIALLALLLCSCQYAYTAAQELPRTSPGVGDVLLEHVRVFDPVTGGFGDTVDILVRGDRIAAVGDLGLPPNGVAHLDAGGRYALPGLWDSHVHLSFLTLAGDSAVAEILAAFVRHGVTSVRDVGGPLDTIAGLSRRGAGDSLLGPRVYFAGPLLTGAPTILEGENRALPGTRVVVESEEAVDSILDVLVARGATMTKAIDRWDPNLLRHYVQAARRRNLRVVWDAGLPILDPIPIDTALALGIKSIEHAKAVWSGVLRDDLAREYDSTRAVGGPHGAHEADMLRWMTLGERSVSPERLSALAEAWAGHDAYLCPTLAVAVDNLAGSPPEPYRVAYSGLLAVSWLFVRELARHGVKMLVGQDGAWPDGALREMDLLAAAGVSPVEILRGATIYPARWLGVDSVAGTIEPGKLADIVVLDADPLDGIANVRSTWAVMKGGRFVHDAAGSTLHAPSR